ncbi:hypothetical protein Goklo_025086 [Gossypium klotzschianum]|uniref:DUF7745 domain-containing protein n=1 Tax=Gossypium klotzschianum TaxID=34286 RepID=A0A7J8W736_9ROSI|nr:hypothetical protein [Gossypium klotzschianum]
MSEKWVTARIKQKGENKCIPWKNLQELILGHTDARKRFDAFALSIYGLVIFPKALGHVDEVIECMSKGGFIGCVQLLLAWFHNHFWKINKVSYRVFSENYSPLTEIAATPRRDAISEEKWLVILQNLREEDVEWRASCLLPDEILYRCGNFDWVPLLGIWGADGYAPLMVLRQYRVAELERSLHQYRSRNSAMELRASLGKIEEMKERIEKLESALRSCEIRTEYLETNESRQNEQLYHLQNQVENRNRIMGEAVV